MNRLPIIIFLSLLIFIFTACPSRQNGSLEGAVSPPGAGARITVDLEGKPVTSLDVASPDGRFTISLPPGSYDVAVTSPSSPFPMKFPGVVVEAAKTTTLPPIVLAPFAGNAALYGKITPAVVAARVALISGGMERAAVNTNAEGLYEFTGLPEGDYTVQASIDGYARDAFPVRLEQYRSTAQNIRLLYITSIEGVDWNAGTIRTVGVGMPSPNIRNITASREMAKRAALADGERNLLKIIEQVRLGPDQLLKSFLGLRDYTEKVRGLIRGHRVVGERELGGGRIELVLELSLTGPNGLSSLIREL